MVHSRIQQRIHCLSLLLRAKPEILNDIQNSFSWDEDEMVSTKLEKISERSFKHFSLSISYKYAGGLLLFQAIRNFEAAQAP